MVSGMKYTVTQTVKPIKLVPTTHLFAMKFNNKYCVITFFFQTILQFDYGPVLPSIWQ